MVDGPSASELGITVLQTESKPSLGNLSFEGYVDKFSQSLKTPLSKETKRNLIFHLAGFDASESAEIIGKIKPHAISENLTSLRRALGIEEDGNLKTFIWNRLGIGVEPFIDYVDQFAKIDNYEKLSKNPVSRRVLFYYLYGYEPREIAQLENKAVQTVKHQLHGMREDFGLEKYIGNLRVLIWQGLGVDFQGLKDKYSLTSNTAASFNP